jgi:DNA-3-methyladenine glycosylase II
MNDVHAQFLAHLDTEDPALAALVRAQGPLEWPEQRPHFEALVRAIVGQQVSTKAASTTFNRLVARVQSEFSPHHLLMLSEVELRSVGLSRQKVAYVGALSTAWVEAPERFEQLETLSDEAVCAALTSIKGIGVWTAQMFLMFTLQRPDVFAPGDLGLKKAMANRLGLAMESPDRAFALRAKRWSPYRSWASLHLWRSLA